MTNQNPGISNISKKGFGKVVKKHVKSHLNSPIQKSKLEEKNIDYDLTINELSNNGMCSLLPSDLLELKMSPHSQHTYQVNAGVIV